jgi:chemotaxis family two-component system sensor kinase Cph1
VDGVNRMKTLINDLLEYSRVGKRDMALKSTEPQLSLQQALSNLQVTLQDRGARVTWDALPIVKSDPTPLTELFQNLISNALKFHSDQPPQIHVSAQRHGAEWVFSVRDNGIGIDPKQATRIFDVFQRLHTREEYPGNGIGLAICKRIVERHGGRIWVESQPGQGATFYFTLPAGEEETWAMAS